MCNRLYGKKVTRHPEQDIIYSRRILLLFIQLFLVDVLNTNLCFKREKYSFSFQLKYAVGELLW